MARTLEIWSKCTRLHYEPSCRAIGLLSDFSQAPPCALILPASQTQVCGPDICNYLKFYECTLLTVTLVAITVIRANIY